MSEQFEPHAELPPEPMLSEAETRRLVERLEARIKETEQLERAIATRPQPSAEPVAVWREAWQAAKVNGAWSTNDNGLVLDLSEEAAAAVIASALEAARREALEQAAKVADEYATWHNKSDDGLSSFDKMALGAEEVAEQIRALKENPNAG